MKPLEFKCPLCACAFIDEVGTGVTAYNEVEVYPDGDLKYGEEECVREKIQTHYACRGCCMTLGRVTDGKSLAEWINLNCTFSIETIRSKLGVSEQQARNIRAILFNLEPLQYEGKNISTSERYLVDANINWLGLANEPMLVISAVSNIISRRDDWPTLLPEVWAIAHSATGCFLAYSVAGKYYFWAAAQDLHEMEEQWNKKKNN